MVQQSSRFAVYALLLTGLLTFAGCGGKDDNDPTDPATATYTVTVQGNTQWQDTGIPIATGNALSFQADGTVVYDNQGNSCDPDGAAWTDTQDQQDPLWTQPHAGLIGKIGTNGASFFIGKQASLSSADAGNLFLGVNDFWYLVNTGEFTVAVTVADD